ncbi:MAG TPA: efflux RND transporter periplasmic adaptor subunit [Burkholderiales bacterium]|nr:efflux RND transporter periplasmic adaptor subunit [Burkholderiales bacterium]
MIRTVALLAALVIAASTAACGKKEEPAAGAPPKPLSSGPAASGAGGPPPGLPVKAVQVTVGEVQADVSAVGSLLAEESVIIRPELDGRVVDIHFAEGQHVAKGAKLVTLDPAEYRAQLAQADAQVRTDAQRYERAKELLAQKFISQEAVDLAKNNLDRSEALHSEAQVRLSKAIITAPFSGTVGLRLISPGAYVEKGTDIVRLDNISSIKLDFRVPELYAAQVRPGQQVAVRLDAFPGEQFTGRIFAMEPVVDEKTRTILLRARVPNQGLKLKPGMFVRVALTLETRKNAILVPEPAIWPQGQDSFVFRVEGGKAMLTKVEIGARRPGEVEIIAGLSPNDTVVTEGQMKLRDGAPVMVLPSQPAPTAGGGSSGVPPGPTAGALKPAAASTGPAAQASEKKGG